MNICPSLLQSTSTQVACFVASSRMFWNEKDSEKIIEVLPIMRFSRSTVEPELAKFRKRVNISQFADAGKK